MAFDDSLYGLPFVLVCALALGCSTGPSDVVFGAGVTTGAGATTVTSSGAQTTTSSGAGGAGQGGGVAANVGGGGQGGGVGTSAGAGAQGGATTTTGAGGTPVDAIGCSDGTREAYTSIQNEPDIAGCSGGFEVAGVTTAASMQPACNRVSGNSSTNPTGSGCSVEDLCAVGWHVCHGASDVAAHAASGQCDPPTSDLPVFWLTRQVEDQTGMCASPPEMNNLTGCGTLGGGADNSCFPLARRMRESDCLPTAAWFCGNSLPDATMEAAIVVKIGPAEGGVLCCRN